MTEDEYPDEPAPGTNKPEEHIGEDHEDHADKPQESRVRFGPKL